MDDSKFQRTAVSRFHGILASLSPQARSASFQRRPEEASPA
jgi:hypothetical protein